MAPFRLASVIPARHPPQEKLLALLDPAETKLQKMLDFLQVVQLLLPTKLNSYYQ